MDWQDFLFVVLQTVLVVTVPYIGVLISKFFNKVSTTLQEKSDNDMVDKYIVQLENLLSKIVTDIGENYVKELKKQDKFNIDAQKTAFNMAKDRFELIAGEGAKEIITNAIADYDDWIQLSIEQLVAKNK